MRSILYAVGDLFRHFFNWHGRLSRKGFWLAWLGVTIIDLMLSLMTVLANVFWLLLGIWQLGYAVPMFFAQIRRFHDSGKPGFLAVLGTGLELYFSMPQSGHVSWALCIPVLLFWILLFVFLLLPGDPLENRYGKPRPFSPNE